MHGSRTDAASRGAPYVALSVDLHSTARAIPEPDEPFRIGVVGRFRGHARPSSDATAAATRAPVGVDRDDFDDVLAACAPSLRLPLGDGPPVEIEFHDLDDFHPDRLYERLPLFRSLRELRRRLADPASFRAAAQELWGEPPPRPAPPTGGSLLDEIVGGAPAPAAPRDGLADFIRRAVRPSVVAAADARQPEALAQVDAAVTALMRSILHHPEFQALEALWRGLHFLVRRVETGVRLRLYLLDAGAEEKEEQLARLLRQPVDGADGASWAVLVGAGPPVEPEAEALRRLLRLARLARELGAVWIGAADPRLVGAASFGDDADPDAWTLSPAAEWDELRRLPEATSLGLVMPRLLLRAPYGKAADPCDAFDFEEFDGRPTHESLLWGSGAVACTALLAQTFVEQGWSMRPGALRELDGLPFHVVREAGEACATPCAEMPMSERAAARILDAGSMPLAWLKDRDAALLVRFQSIARPAAPLAGRWAGLPRS
jgi:type VI secretion system protein ImpC